jgi:hypothetical protein
MNDIKTKITEPTQIELDIISNIKKKLIKPTQTELNLTNDIKTKTTESTESTESTEPTQTVLGSINNIQDKRNNKLIVSGSELECIPQKLKGVTPSFEFNNEIYDIQNNEINYIPRLYNNIYTETPNIYNNLKPPRNVLLMSNSVPSLLDEQFKILQINNNSIRNSDIHNSVFQIRK